MKFRNFVQILFVLVAALAILGCQLESHNNQISQQEFANIQEQEPGTKATGSVVVYSGLNRGGASKVFSSQKIIANLANLKWTNEVSMDNTINSIVVPAGFTVFVTVDPGFKGTRQGFVGGGSGTIYNLNQYGLANKVTSLHILPTFPAIKSAVNLSEFPHHRENGYSKECQGVTNDGENWYISTKYAIWKFSKAADLNDSSKGVKIFNRPVSNDNKCHIGDITYYNNEIYVPIEHCIGDYPNQMWVINTNGKPLRIAYMHQQSHLSWVAINPTDGAMYTCNSDSKYINVYNRNFANKKPLTAFYRIEITKSLKGIQGGVFGPNNYLYIATHNSPEDISVFQIRAGYAAYHRSLPKGDIDSGEEIEGLTWWDLDHEPGVNGRLPGGQLHWLLLDNDARASQYFYQLFGGKKDIGEDDITMRHIRIKF